jgi:hypothetical protein
MPAEQVDAMCAAPPTSLAAARPRRAGQAPVVHLLRELARRPSVTYARLTTGDSTVEWRREAPADAP